MKVKYCFQPEGHHYSKYKPKQTKSPEEDANSLASGDVLSDMMSYNVNTEYFSLLLMHLILDGKGTKLLSYAYTHIHTEAFIKNKEYWNRNKNKEYPYNLCL